MQILISAINPDKYGTYITASTEKTEALIGFYKDGSINVVCKNAAHRVWRGAGRHFVSLADALAGYKSASMRALIQAAADVLADVQTLQ